MCVLQVRDDDDECDSLSAAASVLLRFHLARSGGLSVPEITKDSLALFLLNCANVQQEPFKLSSPACSRLLSCSVELFTRSLPVSCFLYTQHYADGLCFSHGDFVWSSDVTGYR